MSRLGSWRWCRSLVLLAGAAGLTSACPSLDEIPLGECGNGVVERDVGEDCDAPEDAKESARGGHCARPNEDHACHWVWSDSVCCPPSTGEGIDGRCRTPSGVYDPDPILRIDEPVVGSQAVDVDGDGYDDLALRYRSREIELRFLGPDATQVPRRDVRPPSRHARTTFGQLEAPADASVDGCGRPRSHAPGSIFIPGEAGVRVLLGRPGGALLSKAFDNFDARVRGLPLTLPGPACGTIHGDARDALPRQFGCTGALLDLEGGLTMAGVILDDEADVDTVELIKLLGTENGLEAVGMPRPTRIALPAWPGCDGMAVSFTGDGGPFANAMVVLGTCDPTTGGAVELARFDGLARDQQRALVFDVDRDGADDVVVASESTMEVWIGDGAGGFEHAYTMTTPQAGDGGRPLALGYLDDDDAFDVVSQDGLYATNGRCPDPQTDCHFDLAGFKEGLEEAIVADVNGDGRGDVVGRAPDEEERLVLVVGTSGPQGIYSFDERPVLGVPRHFTIADFDGSGVDDVAFVLGHDDACASPDPVQILFGERGVPGEAVTVAELAGVNGLSSGILIPSDDDFNGLGDLGIVTSCGEGATAEHRASVVYGNRERTVDSPYALPDAGDYQAWSVFATGRAGPDGARAVVALGYRSPPLDEEEDDDDEFLDPLLLWVIPIEGASDLPTNTAFEPRPTGLASDISSAQFAMITADVDCDTSSGAGCESDEIVIFQSSGSSAASVEDDEPRVTVHRGGEIFTSASCGQTGSGAYADFDGQTSDDGAFANVIATDLDGDGRKDLVGFWVSIAEDVLVASDGYVFWNDGAGFSCPQRIAMPEGELLVKVATSHDGRRAADTLVIASSAGIYRATFDADRALDACARGDEGCARVLDVADVHDVSVIDYDLDGLDDLVVAAGAGAVVMRQLAQDEIALRTTAAREETE